MLTLVLLSTALAGDVLWLDEPSPELRLEVMSAEGGEELQPADLLPADAAWGAKDEAALKGLESSLTDARTFEGRIDGELVIIEQLAVPLKAITALRNEQDREALYRALAYQGFAVDRFFGDDLAADERAAEHRIAIDGRIVPSPWSGAVALEPERGISSYEVADAPSRLRYESVRAHISTALPALLAADLPEGIDLVVDGRPVEISAAGTHKLTPGRHLAHAEWDGRILQRWTLELMPTERETLALVVDPTDLERWLANPAGGAPPRFTLDAIEARRGLLVVDPRSERAYRVDASGTVTEESLGSASSAGTPGASISTDTDGLSVGAALGAGWLGSPDFYFQDPVGTEASFATVNAAALGLGLDLAYDMGLLRVALAADVLLPLGGPHTAQYLDQRMRVRPTPLLAVGIKPIQAAVGYVLPHHLAVGARLSLPITDTGFELRGSALAGLPPRRTRDDDSIWEGHALGTAWLGAGWRL